MRGAGLEPPVVGVQPASLTATLPEHQSELQNLQILNTGHNTLEFSLAVRLNAPGATTSTFAGLSQGNPTASNNAPRHAPAPAMDAPTTSGAESQFHAVTGEFEPLAPSPSLLTCVVEDPSSGSLYAQDLFGNAFRRYHAAPDTWGQLATAPISAVLEGGAALLTKKIYTSYIFVPTTLGVYDTPTNTWATLPRPSSLRFATADVASDGIKYLYFAAGSD